MYLDPSNPSAFFLILPSQTPRSRDFKFWFLDNSSIIYDSPWWLIIFDARFSDFILVFCSN